VQNVQIVFYHIQNVPGSQPSIFPTPVVQGRQAIQVRAIWSV